MSSAAVPAHATDCMISMALVGGGCKAYASTAIWHDRPQRHAEATSSHLRPVLSLHLHVRVSSFVCIWCVCLRRWGDEAHTTAGIRQWAYDTRLRPCCTCPANGGAKGAEVAVGSSSTCARVHSLWTGKNNQDKAARRTAPMQDSVQLHALWGSSCLS